MESLLAPWLGSKANGELRCTGDGVHVAGERMSGTKSTSELEGCDGSAIGMAVCYQRIHTEDTLLVQCLSGFADSLMVVT